MRISTQTREQTFFRAYNVRSRVQQPMFGERHSALRLHKASLPQRRQSGAVAHDFGSLHRKIKMPRRYLRGNALGIETKRRISYYYFSHYLIKCIEERKSQSSNGIFYK